MRKIYKEAKSTALFITLIAFLLAITGCTSWDGDYPNKNPYWLFDEGTTFYSRGDPDAWYH